MDDRNLNEQNLHKCYSKFYLEKNTPLENAKSVLHNYCVRDGLEWAPSVFRRIGKNRTESNVTHVENILKNSEITSVYALVTAVNASIQEYDKNSTLLRRLVFICMQEKIPYNIKIVGNVCTLAMNEPTPMLWDKYPTYLNTDINQKNREDIEIKNAIIIKNLDQLKKEELYLYVVTTNGDIWFVPQFVDGVKMTHSALARKAYATLHQPPDSPVLSSGSIMSIENSLYVNLASGHFKPENVAYVPLLETIISQISTNDQVHIQVPSHYKHLDTRSCMSINLSLVLEEKNFKQTLLVYMNQLKETREEDEHSLLGIIQKIFSTKMSGMEESFSEDEIVKAFHSEDFLCLLEKYPKHFPESIQDEYKNRHSDSQITLLSKRSIK